MDPTAAAAWFPGVLATNLQEVTTDPAALDTSGRWAVYLPYEGQAVFARFVDWQGIDNRGLAEVAHHWRGPTPQAWRSDVTQAQYCAAVQQVREHIAAGRVYQANVCRILSADLPSDTRAGSDVVDTEPNPFALLARLLAGNPAPYAGAIRLPANALTDLSQPILLASASPELFLQRNQEILTSSPIKGTAPTIGQMLAKDEAENVMIVDLVRNDLARVCLPGTVSVPRLLGHEQHPGLAHLVSDVSGQLRRELSWSQILAATFPPGSVTGAPKSTALSIINAVERSTRGPYCGGFGWVDADRGTAQLAVTIRTFWLQRCAATDTWRLHFGAGAGITWGSDPEQEWRETELKAAKLIGLASDSVETDFHKGEN